MDSGSAFHQPFTTMIHQDDLQFWLLEHKTSKSHVLTDAGLINRIAAQSRRLQNASERLTEAQLSPSEAMQIAISISVDAFILAEKIHP
jgi:hypothetical protein